MVISEVHPCGMQGCHPIPLTGLSLRDKERQMRKWECFGVQESRVIWEEGKASCPLTHLSLIRSNLEMVELQP